MSQPPKKKLIEVALPLDAINRASATEKSIRHGHPSTLHLWWARRPLAAARAVIFAQMVDDPSAHPDIFKTEKAQEKERKRLFRIIEDLALWESTSNEKVLEQARNEIWQSWRYTCAENADHPRAKELFNRQRLPVFHDPFAGGGSLPLEAQRLGLVSYASDINPVSVLINKAMIEIPPKFSGKAPVNPASHKTLFAREWHGTQGLAEDVRYYGRWMRDEAEKRIGHLYPKVQVTPEMAVGRSDLKKYEGHKLTVVAWLWARTVKSPNPAFSQVDVPLASTFMLSTKPGKEVYVEPVIERDSYRFTVKTGSPTKQSIRRGTSAGKRAAFECVMSGTPITYDYIRSEGQAGRMRTRLMAVVMEGDRGRLYVTPTPEIEALAATAEPQWVPDVALPSNPRDFKTPNYGLMTFGDLFTPRQLVVLTTFSDLVQEALELVNCAATSVGLQNNGKSLSSGGADAKAYSEAVAVYLTFALSKALTRNCTQTVWYTDRDSTMAAFSRQAIPMTWDFAEVNPLLESTGSIAATANWVAEVIEGALTTGGPVGHATQFNAASESPTPSSVISCDPPYYDNIGYADLSDFFYIWLRRSLRPIFPDLFTTVAVPKAEELVATPYRHGSKERAEAFFLEGMTKAMNRLAHQTHPAFPITIYYAFKQSETKKDIGTASTGWETFLDAVIRAGLSVSGTWPIRTEQPHGLRVINANALASSIVLVCRPRAVDAPIVSRRDFVTSLKSELPAALAHLQRGNIAPVDLAQAAIGPGMAIYTRYSKVLDAEGKSLTVREALALINQMLDESLAEQDGDFDADSRWALAWFEQFGFNEGEFGVAEILSKAKVTSVQGLKDAGILDKKTSGGKVRLLRPKELSTNWDPVADPRLTAWEMVHHLIRVLETDGEVGAAALAAKLGSKAEIARELCYRLYTICERKKRAAEALSYNALVQSWPEIVRLVHERSRTQAAQPGLFDAGEIA